MAAHNSPKLSRSWARLDGVDILRGLAIFFVLMNHVNMRLLSAKVPYTRGMPPQLASSLVWNGQFGVQIFFVVSGFLITSTALRRWGSPACVNVREFYQLRFARIAPLLVLLLAVLCCFHLAHVKGFVVSQKTGGLGAALLAALSFRVNLLEARHGYLPANWDILWSLSIEETFYFFFPLACRIFRRTRFLLIPLCVFVVVGPFARSFAVNHNPVWREYSYLGGMDAIALGCITALFSAKYRLSRVALRIATGVGAALLVFCLCFSTLGNQWGLGRRGLDMSILALGTCMAITAAAQTRWQAPRVFSPLLGLGRRSYEIYLTHLFVVLGLFDLFIALGKPMAEVPILFLAAILVSGLLGELVAWGYSERANKWLRRQWGDGPQKIGSVVPAGEAATPVE